MTDITLQTTRFAFQKIGDGSVGPSAGQAAFTPAGSTKSSQELEARDYNALLQAVDNLFLGGSSSAQLSGPFGNINVQIPGVAGGVNPGATGADNVLAVYSLPANFFDVAKRALSISAFGNFGANANTKTVKLWFNPSAAVVGSTITGGTLLATTGAVATNNGGWYVSGNVTKRGAAGSNTQTTTSNGAMAGAVGTGVSLAVDTTAVENAPILIAVTGNAATAVGDIIFSMLEVTANQ